MTTRIRLLLMLVLLVMGGSSTALVTGSTLTAVVFDGATWSPPPAVHMAVAQLRDEGHEIRVVDCDVTNGDDAQPAELHDLIDEAKRHGLPAIVFKSGNRLAAADVPLDKDDFVRAVK